MNNDSLQAAIEHRITELRAAYPRISSCRATMEHQSLVSGPARANAEQAVEAAFDVAARSLTSHA